MKFLKVGLVLTLTALYMLILQTNLCHLPPIGRFLNPVSGFWKNAESQVETRPKDILLPRLSHGVIMKFDKN